MDSHTNVVLAVHVYERHMLWYVMSKPQHLRRRVIARGQVLFDRDEGPLDEFQALMEVAMEAYRLHGR